MVNLLAFVVATLFNFILGALWYSPILFGNVWLKAIGMKKEDMKMEAKPMVYGLIVSLVMTYVLALIISMTNTVDFMSGLFLGFLVWLGFVATTGFDAVIYEGKTKSVYFIYIFYRLVALTISGGILAIWV